MLNVESTAGADVFGDGYSVFSSICNEVSRDFGNYKFKIMKDANFQKVMARDFKKSQKIIWEELVYGSAYCSMISIMRSSYWIKGVLESYENRNLFTYSSSLRSLIECAGDSNHSLGRASYFWLQNITLIKNAIKGKSAENIICEDLENLLIHFEHGGSVRNKGQLSEMELPIEYLSLRSADYIESASKVAGDDIQELYKLLCGFVHPSNLTVWSFIEEEEKGAYYIYNNKDSSSEVLEVINKRYHTLICKILQHINMPLVILKTLMQANVLRKNKFIMQLNLDSIEIVSPTGGWSLPLDAAKAVSSPG